MRIAKGRFLWLRVCSVDIYAVNWIVSCNARDPLPILTYMRIAYKLL